MFTLNFVRVNKLIKTQSALTSFEMEEDVGLCVFCCYSFRNSSVKQKFGSSSSSIVILSEFCRKVLAEKKDNITTTTTSTKYLKAWSQFLDDPDLRACADCLSVIDKVIITRSKITKVEERVRKLQTEILKEMRELQSGIGHFYFEMMNVESIIRNSDKASLDNCGNLLAFRNKVLDVASTLDGFKVKLSSKLPHSNSAKKVSILSVKRNEPIIEASIKVEIENEKPEGFQTEAEYDDDMFESGESHFPNSEMSTGESFPEVAKSDSDDEEEEEQVNSELDSEEEAKTSSTYKKMSNWKKQLVLSINTVARKKYYHEAGLLDTRKIYPMKYDFTTDKLKIGPVLVLINQETKLVKCSRCSFRIDQEKTKTLRLSLGRTLYNHVLGKHLHHFACRKCDRGFSNYEGLKYHYMSHEGEKGDYSCDVCERPGFTHKTFLQLHKWSHLNEEEKKEARKKIQEGKTDGPLSRTKYFKKKKSKLPCITCGKLYWPCHLKEHELTHKNPNERTRILCSKCGNSFLPKSMRTHKKICFRSVRNKSRVETGNTDTTLPLEAVKDDAEMDDANSSQDTSLDA